MTIQQALRKLSKDPEINISQLAKELHISRSTIYRYISGERNPQGLDNFGLAIYLYLKYNIETDELKEYRHLLVKN